MTKKTPIKNYDPSINLRISKVLKQTIQDAAENKNITISKYIRELLEDIYSGDYCKKEVVKSKITHFLYSKEFMQLMIWIYKKKSDNKIREDDYNLNKYIKTLKQIDGHLPSKLVIEFDKILKDLLFVKNQSIFSFKRLNSLGTVIESEKFNLELVEDFLLNDNEINMFINIEGISKINPPKMSGLELIKNLNKNL